MNSRARPRVLLVEDDASLQRFVGMALEDFEIELRTVSSVEEGLSELALGSFALILTDLMLPGRSGFDLIDALAQAPGLRGQARLAVFSAGLNPQTRQRLTRPDVWRLLSKPCSLSELEACVRDALASPGETPGANAGAGPTAAPATSAADDPAARAIRAHFGGNEALYRAFHSSCLLQFQADLAEGERALANADAPALRRLAHSLKSVLLTLGHTDASALARALEDSSESADWSSASVQWQALRGQLKRLH